MDVKCEDPQASGQTIIANRKAEWLQGAPLTEPAKLAKLRILIAEDNQDSAESLKKLLEMLGYEVYVANDGEAAVRCAATFGPDVILMDIGLPGMNGFDAARQIRAQRADSADSPDKRVLIVALTGWGQEADRQRSAAAGIDHHLVKPLDLAALRRILDSLPPPAAG